MKRSLMIGVALTAALATTAAQAAPTDIRVEYRMPKTTPVVTAVVTITSCNPEPVMTAQLSLAARADTGPAYALAGDGLRSWRVKRDFTLTVDEAGRLSGINSEGEDQIGSIIGDTVKFVLSIASLGSLAKAVDGQTPPPPGTQTCTEEVKKALLRTKVIRDQLQALRDDGWAAGKPVPDAEASQKIANALAAELAALETGILRVAVSKDVAIAVSPKTRPNVESRTPDFSASIFEPGPDNAFVKWFGPAASMPADLTGFSLNATVLPLVSQVGLPKETAACRLALPVPQPVPARFDLIRPPGQATTPVSSVEAPVQQWAQDAQICLDVGLFATRKLKIAWNSFGLTTSFYWGSNAPAAAVTQSLAGAAENYAKYREEHQPDSATAVAGAQADLAEAKIRAIQADRCLALLQAGGKCEE